MEHINNRLLGRQVGETFKWLCFLNYICLKTDKRFGGKLDDIQYILESVSENKSCDISETAQWWEQFYEDANCNEYATNLIKNVRNAGRESRLSLPPQKRKSLSFYFAEFRGLAISLRAARDSAEHHVSQGANKEHFSSLYGSIALRIFAISTLLKDLVAEVAKANPEEVNRFGLKLVTASSSELEEYRHSVGEVLDKGSKSRETDEATDGLTQELLVSLLDEVQDRLSEQLIAAQGELMSGITKSKAEILESLRVTAIQPGRQLHGPDATAIKALPSVPSSLTRDELFNELVKLRDKIYTAMAKGVTGFEHWHNILQKPLIAEACRLGCKDLESFKAMPGFRSRIITTNRAFALREQEELFGAEIDQVLQRAELA